MISCAYTLGEIRCVKKSAVKIKIEKRRGENVMRGVWDILFLAS
jgi:hypothetical protein